MPELLERFAGWDPIVQAFVAGLFTWAITALGAALVLVTPVSERLLDAMLGFAAGVMISASCWSLLVPSVELAEALGYPGWLPATTGFLAGGVFLRLADALLPHLHPGLAMKDAEGVPTTWRRSTLLVLAITLHNVPEGLAVGVAFGAAASQLGEGATLAAAFALTLGIGLQNLPEGVAVAMPLRRDGLSRAKCFWYGQLSAVVEPAAAALGAAAVLAMRPLLPFALAFAAGAMIYVVTEELIPESQQHGAADLATSMTLIGFAVMMALDVAFG
jgi:zinc transporter, ZIP family